MSSFHIIFSLDMMRLSVFSCLTACEASVLCSFRVYYCHHIPVALLRKSMYDLQFARVACCCCLLACWWCSCLSLTLRHDLKFKVHVLHVSRVLTTGHFGRKYHCFFVVVNFGSWISHRLMLALMPASWGGLWLPTVSVKWWPHPFLAFGPITGHVGSR